MKSYKKMCESNKEIERELYDAIKSGGDEHGKYYTKSEIDSKFDETRESIQEKLTSGEILSDDTGVYLILE